MCASHVLLATALTFDLKRGEPMIVYRNFEGDVRQPPGQAAHDVTFKEATTVFAAGDLAISEDPTTGDLRAMGTSARGRRLVVRHRRGQRIRILGVALCDADGQEIAVPASAEDTRTSASKADEPDTTGASDVEAGANEKALSKLDAAEEAAREKSPARRKGPSPRVAIVGANEPNAARALEAIKRAAAARAMAPNGESTSTLEASSALTRGAIEVSTRGDAEGIDRDGLTPGSDAESIETGAIAKGARTSTDSVRSDEPGGRSWAGSASRASNATARELASRSRGPATKAVVGDIPADGDLSARESAIEESAPPLSTVRPIAGPRRRAQTRVASDPLVHAAPAKGPTPTNIWTAETYDVYWRAYTTARDEARREGKSTRDAQRLGREAGERAATTRSIAPPREERQPPRRRAEAMSWREAARAVKLEK